MTSTPMANCLGSQAQQQDLLQVAKITNAPGLI